MGQVTSRTDTAGLTTSFSTVRAAEADEDKLMATTYGALYADMKRANRKGGKLPSVSGMKRGRTRRRRGDRYRRG
jgi:hypothetical protein